MIRITVLLSVILAFITPVTLAANATPDLAVEVRAVFAAKCAACHGPDLPQPKGRFGYVTDLARVASNPEFVIPSSPEESELWELVRRGEMPPADSPSGPLTPEQKDTIRAWIAAGAPTEPSAVTANDSSPPAASLVRHVLGGIGRFHILVIHFPIALFLSAALAELWAATRGLRTPLPAVRYCVALGAAGAVVAATLGWLHAGAGFGAGSQSTLALHRWLGTAAAISAVVTAALSEWDQYRGRRTVLFRTGLIAGSLLVALTGHLGGVLVHGDGFLFGR